MQQCWVRRSASIYVACSFNKLNGDSFRIIDDVVWAVVDIYGDSDR